MRPNWNTGQVSVWGSGDKPFAMGAGGALDAARNLNKSGLPNVSVIWGQTSTVLTQNYQYCFAFLVHDPITVDAYLYRPNAGSATAVLKAYIYRMGQRTYASGTAAQFITGTDSTLNVTAGGAVTTTLASAVTLYADYYFLLLHCTTAASPQMWSGNVTNNWMGGWQPDSGTSIGVSRAGWLQANDSTAPASSFNISNGGSSGAAIPVALRWT